MAAVLRSYTGTIRYDCVVPLLHWDSEAEILASGSARKLAAFSLAVSAPLCLSPAREPPPALVVGAGELRVPAICPSTACGISHSWLSGREATEDTEVTSSASWTLSADARSVNAANSASVQEPLGGRCMRRWEEDTAAGTLRAAVALLSFLSP